MTDNWSASAKQLHQMRAQGCKRWALERWHCGQVVSRGLARISSRHRALLVFQKSYDHIYHTILQWVIADERKGVTLIVMLWVLLGLRNSITILVSVILYSRVGRLILSIGARGAEKMFVEGLTSSWYEFAILSVWHLSRFD
jgi:hypothetical protein